MSTYVRCVLGAVLCLMPAVLMANAANGDPRLEKLFTTFGLERRMKAVGLWPFKP